MGFEDILGKVSELAQTGVAKAKELTDVGVAKTKELAEISKLKVENASEQESIKKAYLEIGKLYFAERAWRRRRRTQPCAKRSLRLRQKLSIIRSESPI